MVSPMRCSTIWVLVVLVSSQCTVTIRIQRFVYESLVHVLSEGVVAEKRVVCIAYKYVCRRYFLQASRNVHGCLEALLFVETPPGGETPLNQKCWFSGGPVERATPFDVARKSCFQKDHEGRQGMCCLSRREDLHRWCRHSPNPLHAICQRFQG